MRSSFVPKSQPKITEISALEVYYFKVDTKRESMYFLQEDRLSFVLNQKYMSEGIPSQLCSENCTS